MLLRLETVKTKKKSELNDPDYKALENATKEGDQNELTV